MIDSNVIYGFDYNSIKVWFVKWLPSAEKAMVGSPPIANKSRVNEPSSAQTWYLVQQNPFSCLIKTSISDM